MKTGISIVRQVVVAVVLCLSGLAYAASGSVTYIYDDLGRLVEISYSDGARITFTYDAAGNRTQQLIEFITGTLTWSETVNPCVTNCWGDALW